MITICSNVTPVVADVSSTAPARPLTPRLDDRWRALLSERSLITSLVAGIGSPVNLLMPDLLVANAADYRSVYERHRLRGSIYFAHKANRSSALIRRLAGSGIGVDVASVGELQHTLAAGVPGTMIMATGPKPAEYLWLAARVGAIVNADSAEELDLLGRLVDDHELSPVRVMIRLSGFPSVGVAVLSRPSRFGVPVPDLGRALDALDRHRDRLSLHGLAFHLDTNSLNEKALAVETCLLALSDCRSRGHAPSAIDIGGGFGVSYLADRDAWLSYTDELSASVLGRRPPMTWAGHGYGLRAERGALRGTPGVYPGFREIAGARYLEELLSADGPTLGRGLSTLLLENLVEVHVEPGRALLDQVGLTVLRVDDVRQGPDGQLMINVAGNAHDISMEDHGVLIDPILIPVGRQPSPSPSSGYLLGNLCLESDLLTRRAVQLSALPRPGDLLAFANTAGYFMDFAANDALMQPTARKVVVEHDGTGWQWCLDEQYWPLRRSNR